MSCTLGRGDAPKAPCAIPPHCRPTITGLGNRVLYARTEAGLFYPTTSAPFRAALGSPLHSNRRASAHRTQAGMARSDAARRDCTHRTFHDNAYAIGAVDFTGDMPVILGPDGPPWAASCARRRW